MISTDRECLRGEHRSRLKSQDMNAPYRINLVVVSVKSADILPMRLLHTYDILQIFDDWPTEIQSKICPVVVASCMPTLLLVIFVCWFMVYEGLHGDGV